METKREIVFNQFLRPLKGIGLPIAYDIPEKPDYPSQLSYDRNKKKFMFSIENENEELEWAMITRAKTIIKITEDYQIDEDDYLCVVEANKSLTITLPEMNKVAGYTYIIKKTNDCYDIVIKPKEENVKIDGLDKMVISQPYRAIQLISNGETWLVLSSF
jgi:hypothetical protein